MGSDRTESRPHSSAGPGHRLGMRLLRRRTTTALIGWIGAIALRALGATWRVSIEGPNPLAPGAPPILGAFWHRNLLIAAFAFRDRRYSVPVSRSRDGNLIAETLTRLGYAPPPRGSSSRGGAGALRGLVRLVKSGTTISIQTDGPRGPARQSKPGIVSLSRVTGAALIPIGFSASPCFRFRSWDSTLLPPPFARVICEFGEPIAVPNDASAEREEAIRQQLDARLNEMTDRLDGRLGLRDRRGNSPRDRSILDPDPDPDAD